VCSPSCSCAVYSHWRLNSQRVDVSHRWAGTVSEPCGPIASGLYSLARAIYCLSCRYNSLVWILFAFLILHFPLSPSNAIDELAACWRILSLLIPCCTKPSWKSAGRPVRPLSFSFLISFLYLCWKMRRRATCHLVKRAAVVTVVIPPTLRLNKSVVQDYPHAAPKTRRVCCCCINSVCVPRWVLFP
jgi:hypothetical protein